LFFIVDALESVIVIDGLTGTSTVEFFPSIVKSLTMELMVKPSDPLIFSNRYGNSGINDTNNCR
jgi:hypothetical protein